MATIEAISPDKSKIYYSSKQSSLESGIRDYFVSVLSTRFSLKEKHINILKQCDLPIVLGCFCNLQKTLFTSKGGSFEVFRTNNVDKSLKERPAKTQELFEKFVCDSKQGEPSLSYSNGPLWRKSCKEVIRKDNLRKRCLRKNLLKLIGSQKIVLPNDVVLDKSISLSLIKPFYDITLFEWDMHHASVFNDNDDLLFFIVRNNKIYMVALGPHKLLNDDEFVRSAYSHWPELFADKLQLHPGIIDPKWTPEQRKNIRGAGSRYVTSSVNIDESVSIFPKNSFDVSLSLPLRVRQELDILLSRVPNNLSHGDMIGVSQKLLSNLEAILLS